MREIFRLSGLETQLGSLDMLVEESLAQSLQSIPTEQAERVKRAVLTELSAPQLQQQVASRLEKVHHPQHAAAALRWLRSPQGRRITQLEIEASTPESVRALEAYAQQLRAEPPREVRLGLARELDRAIGATQFAVEVSLASARAAMSAMSGVLPAERRLDAGQIEAAIGAQREAMREGLAQASLLSTLHTYRDLTDAELEAYLAFAKSDTGRWYHGAVKQALLEALTDVAGRMGRTVASALRSAPDPARAPRALTARGAYQVSR
jgi:hypothetical protein